MSTIIVRVFGEEATEEDIATARGNITGAGLELVVDGKFDGLTIAFLKVDSKSDDFYGTVHVLIGLQRSNS